MFDVFSGPNKTDALLHGHSYTAHPMVSRHIVRERNPPQGEKPQRCCSFLDGLARRRVQQRLKRVPVHMLARDGEVTSTTANNMIGTCDAVVLIRNHDGAMYRAVQRQWRRWRSMQTRRATPTSAAQQPGTR